MARSAFVASRWALAVVFLGAAACDSPTGPPTSSRVAPGPWGGDRILLTVTDSGGTLQQFCAQGTIDRPLMLDSSGRFDAAGSYMRQRGGPAREGDIHPARFTGSTDGMTLTLTVTQTDDGQVFGPFSMRFGSVVDVGPCPLV